jgi:hypothetical protein
MALPTGSVIENTYEPNPDLDSPLPPLDLSTDIAR